MTPTPTRQMTDHADHCLERVRALSEGRFKYDVVRCRTFKPVGAAKPAVVTPLPEPFKAAERRSMFEPGTRIERADGKGGGGVVVDAEARRYTVKFDGEAEPEVVGYQYLYSNYRPAAAKAARLLERL